MESLVRPYGPYDLLIARFWCFSQFPASFNWPCPSFPRELTYLQIFIKSQTVPHKFCSLSLSSIYFFLLMCITLRKILGEQFLSTCLLIFITSKKFWARNSTQAQSFCINMNISVNDLGRGTLREVNHSV